MTTANTLLDTLIGTTTFPQATPIWQDGLEKAVFEPFFACFLTNLLDEPTAEHYRTFVATTKDKAEALLATGGMAGEFDEFWQFAKHTVIASKLHQATFVDEPILRAVLPLAIHTAFDKLVQMNGDSAEIDTIIGVNLDSILPALPAWADEVVGDEALARVQVESLLNQSLLGDDGVSDNSDNEAIDTPSVQTAPTQAILAQRQEDETQEDAYDSLDDNLVSMPDRSINPLLIAVPALLLLAGLAGGGFYFYKKNQTPTAPVVATETAPKPVVAKLPPPTLSITVGQSGELYACSAELGNSGLGDTLVNILQTSFSTSLCVIDINEGVNQNMQGLDKLISVLALLKTVPFASLEIVGDKAYINAPDTAKITTLTSDIGALLAGIQVMPMPALNQDKAISDSIARATDALNALPKEAQDFQIARALSLQIIDTTKPLPETNKAVLALAANYLKNKPEARLIIVAHSDDMGDAAIARTSTQMVANEIKNELMAQGVSDFQLVAQGVGFDFPKADNQTEMGRFKNRRVEFLVYDDAVLQALTAGKPQIQPQVIEQQVAPTAPPAETAIHSEPATPTTPALAVQGNQIVEVAPQMPVQDISAPPIQTPAPNVSYGGSGSSGGIPDDLLKPIGNDPVTGGEATQYVEVR